MYYNVNIATFNICFVFYSNLHNPPIHKTILTTMYQFCASEMTYNYSKINPNNISSMIFVQNNVTIFLL